MIYPTWYYTSSGFGPEKLASDLHTYDSPPLPIVKGASKLLITESDVRDHLDLLSIFHKVHHAVHKGGVVVDALSGLPVIGVAQTLFLARAQHRFDLWTERVLQRPYRDLGGSVNAEEVPPIDVLMLLHSYMLRPLNYLEDLIRVYPCLVGVGPFPLKAVGLLIDRSKMEFVPTAEQVELWESLTMTPFEPPFSTLPTEEVDVKCPRCLTNSNVPWINNKGTGAGQVLSRACGSCGLTVNSEALSVGKFLRDMWSPRILPYTIFDGKGFENLESAQAISQFIKGKLDIRNATDGDQFDWTMASVKAALFACPDILAQVGEYRTKELLSAYNHPASSSFDLKSAAMRQARFISTMHDIQWAGEKSFGSGALILNAIIHYHQFFLRSSEISIPSVGVDMAFHTHLLSAANFINDCRNILGRVVDHNDSMERSEIALGPTVDTWESSPYGYPINIYSMHCSSEPTCAHCGQKSGHSYNCPNK